MARILHWFRNDLRVHDNPSFYAATVNPDDEVHTCFVLSPVQWQRHDESACKLGLLKAHLTSLQQSLHARGFSLHIRRGTDYDQEIDLVCELMKQLGCDTLSYNEEYGSNERRRDRQISERLKQQNIQVNRYRDQSIAPVGSVLTQEQRPYTVFTPFKKRWLMHLSNFPTAPLPAPTPRSPFKHIMEAHMPAEVDALWEGVPTRTSAFQSGEDNALKRLAHFVETALVHYDQQRDFPSLDGTSQLSPYLALGILSPRQCLHYATQFRALSERQSGIDCWINELIWRDFYIHILYHFPGVSRHLAFKPETEQLHWQGDGPAFKAWCEAKTGIPIVDAAMRQLLQTGWMHNRLRMICAMFLTKNLFVDWRLGERFFMRHLVDGYLPANNGGWQWSASTGTDAAPYFRIFNPVSQSERFDPEGRFIRHFVPELAHRNNRTIHLPLEQPEPDGKYPLPIVDLKISRQQAIDAFKALSAPQVHTGQADLFRNRKL